MKPNPAPDNEEPLRDVLRQWVVDTPLPPRFQEQVWRRITLAEASPAPSLWTRLLNLAEVTLPIPRFAYSYVAILLLLGVGAGSWAAQRHTARLDASLGSRYIQSVDPYQTPAFKP